MRLVLEILGALFLMDIYYLAISMQGIMIAFEEFLGRICVSREIKKYFGTFISMVLEVFTFQYMMSDDY